MIRKTISFLALTTLLATALAFAGSEPAAVPEETSLSVQAAPAEPAPQPALPDLEDLFGESSCAPQPASVIPGCSVICKVDRDCPHYPDQVCTRNGCCVY